MAQLDLKNAYDFVIVGAGVSGLTAALTAATSGHSVLVLEQSDKVGGTACFSGGLLWVPLNPKGAEIGVTDDRDAAIKYIEAAMDGPSDPELVAAYVDHAAETLTFLENNSPFEALNTSYPDTFVEVEGGKTQGRHLEPKPYGLRKLKSARKTLRDPAQMMPITNTEIFASGVFRDFKRAMRKNLPKVLGRLIRGERAGGQALMAALYRGALDAGVDFALNSSVEELIVEADAVKGVKARFPNGLKSVTGRKAVILSNGGWEWNDEEVKARTGLDMPYRPSPPLSKGDNLKLAKQVDAAIERENETWPWPVAYIPGSSYEGEPTATLVLTERTMPHCLWVNQKGERFVNEASHNCALALFAKGKDGNYPNSPAWSIMDAQYRVKYPILFKAMPGNKDPEWVIRAESLEDLAAKLDIDVDALRATLDRFNGHVRAGEDKDFGRGSFAYERYIASGDTEAPANATLGTVEKPPFYALRVYPSAVGTRGGPKTDAKARVLREDGSIVPGLYAAGNAAACFHGPNMVGGGSTIVAGMVFARQAALDAIKRN